MTYELLLRTATIKTTETILNVKFHFDEKEKKMNKRDIYTSSL